MCFSRKLSIRLSSFIMLIENSLTNLCCENDLQDTIFVPTSFEQKIAEKLTTNVIIIIKTDKRKNKIQRIHYLSRPLV